MSSFMFAPKSIVLVGLLSGYGEESEEGFGMGLAKVDRRQLNKHTSTKTPC